ncbi:hypothetical protein ACFX2J_002711 [Malus domestica]
MIQMVTLNYGLTHYSDSAAQMLLLNPVTGALHSEATTEFSAFAASADATFSMPVDLREILPSTLKQAARSRAGEHKKTRNRRQICGSVSNDGHFGSCLYQFLLAFTCANCSTRATTTFE